ncbi:beta-galactoside-a-2,6-sialyltransferase [Lycorma delicatula]|uniref:beta-galactoside-a-2,6-sialyltransferase n=1 Tax=Lycorma delicatula TaxID=130591 RepID=UPI003F5161BC
MKAIAFSVWIFINLVCFGMCGYIYLLWSQYWHYISKQQKITISEPSRLEKKPLVDYFQDLAPVDMHDVEWRHQKSAPVKRNSRPRFVNVHYVDLPQSTTNCGDNCGESSMTTDSQLAAFKNKLIVRLRQVMHDESSVFKSKNDNPYNVFFNGVRSTNIGSSQELVCKLSKVTPHIRTIDGKDEPFAGTDLGVRIPNFPLFSLDERYNNCAIISNSGAFKNSNLGSFIDSHDLVLRFNHAPTDGYEKDVGSKTTIRILNSQVLSKPEFNFLNSPLYKDIKLVAWDPSNYTSTLKQWLKDPDFDVFSPYIKHRDSSPETNFHLIDPRDLWRLWNFLQAHTSVRIRKNPPSSGFLGLALLLPYCSYVNMFEYIPSMRLTSHCHYFDITEDESCTFGVWHPLAAEKLLALNFNQAPDRTVFQTGYITIPGYSTVTC